jgi:hypothetical protein
MIIGALTFVVLLLPMTVTAAVAEGAGPPVSQVGYQQNVSNPHVDFGWTSATVTLNPKDQRIILSSGGAGAGSVIGAVISAAACSETGPGAVLCGAAGGAFGAVIGSAASSVIKEYGVKEHCNVKVKFGYFPPHVEKVWRSGKGC